SQATSFTSLQPTPTTAHTSRTPRHHLDLSGIRITPPSELSSKTVRRALLLPRPAAARPGRGGCAARSLPLLPELPRDRRRRLRDRLGIAEVVVAERLQVVSQLVDERHAGRDVELDDLLVGDAVE